MLEVGLHASIVLQPVAVGTVQPQGTILLMTVPERVTRRHPSYMREGLRLFAHYRSELPYVYLHIFPRIPTKPGQGKTWLGN